MWLLLLGALPGSPAQALPELLIDAEDGRFDASAMLMSRHGFLPVPLIVTEPALGYGAPTGIEFFDRPFRYVLEAAHTTYLGSQAGVLGFNHMSSLGSGIEFDTSAYDIIISRTRLVLRYAFGQDISGYSVGLAVSF